MLRKSRETLEHRQICEPATPENSLGRSFASFGQGTGPNPARTSTGLSSSCAICKARVRHEAASCLGWPEGTVGSRSQGPWTMLARSQWPGLALRRRSLRWPLCCPASQHRHPCRPPLCHPPPRPCYWSRRKKRRLPRGVGQHCRPDKWSAQNHADNQVQIGSGDCAGGRDLRWRVPHAGRLKAQDRLPILAVPETEDDSTAPSLPGSEDPCPLFIC